MAKMSFFTIICAILEKCAFLKIWVISMKNSKKHHFWMFWVLFWKYQKWSILVNFLKNKRNYAFWLIWDISLNTTKLSFYYYFWCLIGKYQKLCISKDLGYFLEISQKRRFWKCWILFWKYQEWSILDNFGFFLKHKRNCAF